MTHDSSPLSSLHWSQGVFPGVPNHHRRRLDTELLRPFGRGLGVKRTDPTDIQRESYIYMGNHIGWVDYGESHRMG
jgi:hypothetical protein